MNKSCHTYEWVVLHVWMSHVTHLNESCHTYEWVMLHVWMSHVTHMNESCYTYEWVTSHRLTWMYMSERFICSVRLNKSCHICRVLSHVTRLNESCHTYEWVTSHRLTWTHISEIVVCSLLHTYLYMCDMTEISHVHRKSSLYLPLSSVNLVLKLMGNPDGISTRSGWNRVSRWWCRVSPGIYILSWLKL